MKKITHCVQLGLYTHHLVQYVVKRIHLFAGRQFEGSVHYRKDAMCGYLAQQHRLLEICRVCLCFTLWTEQLYGDVVQGPAKAVTVPLNRYTISGMYQRLHMVSVRLGRHIPTTT